jgi:hypothetical protein
LRFCSLSIPLFEIVREKKECMGVDRQRKEKGLAAVKLFGRTGSLAWPVKKKGRQRKAGEARRGFWDAL